MSRLVLPGVAEQLEQVRNSISGLVGKDVAPSVLELWDKSPLGKLLHRLQHKVAYAIGYADGGMVYGPDPKLKNIMTPGVEGLCIYKFTNDLSEIVARWSDEKDKWVKEK